ncbi:hypothetical protein SEPCBS119000_002733 [Sporothrix epigloea]|uniref:Uncharacterized protein n=1 Tax=Sporothrix epigloea TaxID=1892477 RepID=A0ABP0DHS7_9PEZI
MEAPERSIYKIPVYPTDTRAMRLYCGPVRKWDLRKTPTGPMFGPRKDDVELVEELCLRYWGCWGPVAASSERGDGSGRGEVLNSPWLPDGLEKDQQDALLEWFVQNNNLPLQPNNAPPQETEWLSEKRAAPYLAWNVCPRAALHLFPSTCPSAMMGKAFPPGDCLAYDRSTIHAQGNYNEDGSGHARLSSAPASELGESHPEHFIFNAGGRVQSLAWAPTNTASNPVLSLLAVAVVPHDDPAAEIRTADGETEDMRREPEKLGSLQLWWLPLYTGSRPRQKETDYLPRMHRLCCFSWGWPRRMEWCPVTPPEAAVPFLLALLTEDGIVRVIEVAKSHAHRTTYENIIQPLATLGFPDEPTIRATCMSWVGVNRIVVGYHDGSIALWSIRPQMVVLRLPALPGAVQDVCSAYPSLPYLVAVRPVEGFFRLIDLRRPSSEHTFHPSPVAGIRGNLIGWAEHLQGFVSAAPANSPLNNSLDFLHHRHFPLPRRVIATSRESPPTSLAVGKVHPFALVGTADGKVWIANLPDIVFPSPGSMDHAQLALSSEFRPTPTPAPVTVQGSGPSQELRLLGGVAYSTWAASADHRTRPAPKKTAVARPVSDSDEEGGADTGEGSLGIVVHEGLTAVTSIAWHPSYEFGTWGVIGFASGLVLVKNLGLD